ncbi:hypothetical protein CARUB_v10019161mg [Capsella rubella]|uniref:Uncharacterized protein n=1 Tax=Capsella rubella TaxID=81985 RepID=R0H8V7_9BRAS|nr:hypothetical protein CARUB_v10019161mg [Capsella rubella]
MDRIFKETEEIHARKKRRRRTSNFKLDTDIMLLLLSTISRIQYFALQIPHQIRKPATRLGHEYIQKALVEEDRDTFRRLYRNIQKYFLKLCSIFRLEMGLKDTRYVSVEEMLATFLFIVGKNSRYIQLEDRFQRSRFSTKFTYVLSGWEGSAHDAKILNDALTGNTNKLIVPEGKFYLVDCGFANRHQFLAPFRSIRYHLQDFRGQGKDPLNANELFNHRHSSLFLIFKSAPPFPYKTQDGNNEEETDVDEKYDDGNNEEEQLHGTQEQQRVLANNWRATIAATMWTYAMNMGS